MNVRLVFLGVSLAPLFVFAATGREHGCLSVSSSMRKPCVLALSVAFPRLFVLTLSI